MFPETPSLWSVAWIGRDWEADTIIQVKGHESLEKRMGGRIESLFGKASRGSTRLVV